MNKRRWPGSGWALVIIFLMIVISAMIDSAKASERDYQEEWCNPDQGGIIEHVLKDRTRVDCILGSYAIEFDFAKKWAESIGQSLLYASRLNMRPGIVLIMETTKDCKYLYRLREALSFGGISINVWQTGQYAYFCPPE